MKIFKYIIAGLFLVGMISSCKKNIEDEPLEFLTDDIIWDQSDSLGYYSSGYLTGIYTLLPTGFNRIGGAPLDAATDDAVASNTTSTIYQLARGQFSPELNPDDAWASSYVGIRRANVLLANIDKLSFRKDVVYLKDYYKGEALFLKALFYYELVKRYGGVLLLPDRPMTLADDVQIPRNSFDECAQYIVKVCDSAYKYLRPNPLASQDVGRASKVAALALKAKMLLLAASPLNNPSNDVSKWKLAADAAKDLINTNKFSLDPTFTNAFTKRNSVEVIFAKMTSASSNTLEYDNSPVGYNPANTVSRGLVSPTQELADAFGMKTGKGIMETGSGYLPANPYKDRDPRFYLTLFHNDQTWLNRKVETFTGGKDNPTTNIVKTLTGYYARKFMGNNETTTTFAAVDHVWIMFRYAEVLLNYAEAQNEFSQAPDASVLKAITDIRARAGIAAGTDGRYGIKTGITYLEMRELIRNERRVEMAFEEQRFWDIRRWKIASGVYNKPLNGMQVTKTGTTFTYTIAPLSFFTPTFIEKLYRYPIPYTELIRNNRLVQNEGW